MRRNILLLTFLGFFGLAVFLIIRTVIKQKDKEATAARIVRAPEHFSFLTLRNRPFTEDSLPAGRPVSFILFSPTCEHCIAQMEEIYLNRRLYHDLTLLLVTNEDAAATRKFAAAEKLDSLPFAKVLLDTNFSLFRYFGVFSTPSVFIYNGQRRLVKKYIGGAGSENIIKNSFTDVE